MSDWGAEAVFNVTSSLSLGLNVNSRWDRRRWLRKVCDKISLSPFLGF